MNVALVVLAVVALALAFDVSNGFHDSANAVAALVATRAARPASALVLVSVFHLLGPLLAGTAVASTVAGVVSVDAGRVVPVVGAALTGAVLWNLLTWWFGLPSSSSHALVGGLVGAAMVDHGVTAVQWGGVEGLRPTGVVGVLFGLAISPVLGATAGWSLIAVLRWCLRNASRAIVVPIRRAEWVTASALAFSHGANDAQKTMGVITLVLVAQGHLSSFVVPLWVKVAAAGALTVGTALGGWRIVRTVGSGIYRLRPLDGLASQGSSAAVILASAAVGAPVSTTHVVASSVVGVGAAQRRQHVRWAVVKEMGLAWLVTLPAAATAAGATLPVWRWLA